MASQIIVEVIGVGAAVCSTTSFVPQLVKLIRDRTAEAVSAPMFMLTIAAFSLWSAYGVMVKSWPLVLSNLVSLALSAAILVLKLRYHGPDDARAAAAPSPAAR
jgi:MtN3 and saliva related transmembrane protein